MKNGDKYRVYKHVTPNGKVYIGITSKDPLERWRNNGRGYSGNKHFYNAIRKYGWQNIKHEILFTELTKEEACKKEIELIAYCRSNNPMHGYNLSAGGETNAGYKHTEATKKLLSEQHKGFKHTEEAKRKMSVSRKGQPHKGTKHSEESIELMRKVHKHKSVIQYDIDGNFIKIHFSIRSASRETGIPSTNISGCCKGKTKHTHEFVWRYSESEVW